MSINRTKAITCPNCQRRISMVYPSKTIYRHYKNTDPASLGVVCEASGLSFDQAKTLYPATTHELKMPSFLDPLRQDMVSSHQAIKGENVVSIEVLRKDINHATGESFPVGSVIRWEQFSHRAYTFAALKTPVGWIVTGNSGWGLAGETVTYARLVEHLGSNDVSNVALATEWAEL